MGILPLFYVFMFFLEREAGLLVFIPRDPAYTARTVLTASKTRSDSKTTFKNPSARRRVKNKGHTFALQSQRHLWTTHHKTEQGERSNMQVCLLGFMQ